MHYQPRPGGGERQSVCRIASTSSTAQILATMAEVCSPLGASASRARPRSRCSWVRAAATGLAPPRPYAGYGGDRRKRPSARGCGITVQVRPKPSPAAEVSPGSQPGCPQRPRWAWSSVSMADASGSSRSPVVTTPRPITPRPSTTTARSARSGLLRQGNRRALHRHLQTRADQAAASPHTCGGPPHPTPHTQTRTNRHSTTKTPTRPPLARAREAGRGVVPLDQGRP
jgi:hypothetical protein